MTSGGWASSAPSGERRSDTGVEYRVVASAWVATRHNDKVPIFYIRITIKRIEDEITHLGGNLGFIALERMFIRT